MFNSSPKLSTPWGPADHVRDLGDGILSIQTAEHGGLFVPPELLAKMPPALRCNCYAGGGSWFEEDCEWALVALAFPHLFKPELQAPARATIRGCSATYASAAAWINSNN